MRLSPQVDKGVVPLAGTNGETTTQGKNIVQLTKGLPVSDGVRVGVQVWTGCPSAVPSTRKTAPTLPSGAVC